MTERRVRTAASVSGRVVVPGDKSVSHRALMFGALASGITRIRNLAPGQDVATTAAVLRGLGVQIQADGAEWVVHGLGLDRLQAPTAPLDCGNSGTTMRLMMGILAGRPFSSELFGDASLSGRPMGRIADPLSQMGARFDLKGDGGRPPVVVHGGPLSGMDFQSRVASAQVKGAVLLAGLQAPGETRVTEPARSRDHTERMLRAMGAKLTVDGLMVSVAPSDLAPLGDFLVPGDLSSAAFMVAVGLLLPGELRVVDAGTNPTRTGFLDAVALMGAQVAHSDPRGGAEPTATLTATAGRLTGVELHGELVVRAIDEVPILAVLATQAHGRTVIRDAQELRVKECDRLAVTATMLSSMGASVEERPDGLIIDGPTRLRPAEIEPHHDHRIAMAGAVAGLVAQGDVPTIIRGADCAAVSYPGFWDDLGRVTGAVG